MWRSDEIVKATTGKLHGPAFDANGVAIDTRKLKAGALYVALKGERVDGHDFVKDALAAGASGALVDRVPKGLGPDARLVVVNDTYKALVDIAIAARKRTQARIIAVTGSVGKTGTKEAIRLALAGALGETYATQGNLNNHIGLPLSLANLPAAARAGVFELGMNHAGELSFLTRILKPEIAIITNIEAVHLEFFANIEGIADAKAEIMEGLPTTGTIILNRDNAFFSRLETHARAHGIANILTFGAHEESTCRLVDYALEGAGSRVQAVIAGMPITYPLGTIGRHYAFTSLAALAACMTAGADLATAAATLAQFHEPEGRGKILRVLLPQGDITVIDDCYNASPASMMAAIAKLAELKAASGSKTRAVAVLGDMLELGPNADELHKSLAAPLAIHGIDRLYTAGPMSNGLYMAAAKSIRGAHASTAAELAALLPAELRAGDIVLIKGSRGSRMDQVLAALMASTPVVREPAHAL